MPDTLVTTKATVDGNTFETATTVTHTGTVKTESSVAAAKAGTLSTRSNATDGTLTLGAGHGITDGAKIHIYFTGGYAIGATVGTVSGNSVPFTGAVGTAGTGGQALPAQLSAVTVCVVDEDDFEVTAANLKYLNAGLTTPGVSGLAVFVESDGTVVKVASLSGVTGAYQWVTGAGVSNPFGENVQDVLFSHNSTAGAVTMRATALV
jgi:hypothetical protein